VKIWQFFDRYPPILVRLLAKASKTRPMSTLEIAELAGLNPIEVEAVSWSISWDGISIPTARKFLKGCKIDPTQRRQMQNVTTYLNGKVTEDNVRIPPRWGYLRRSPQWKTYYNPMMIRFLKSRTIPRG